MVSAAAAVASSPSRGTRNGDTGLRDPTRCAADGGPGGRRAEAAGPGGLRRRGAGTGPASPRSLAGSHVPGPRPPRWPRRAGRGLAAAAGRAGERLWGRILTEGVAWDPICTLEKVATLASVPQLGGGY